MVLPLIGGVLASLVLSFFAVSAVATLAHWIAVAAGLLAAAGVVYQLIERDLLDFIGFESDILEIMSASFISPVVGFVVYRLVESLFAAVGIVGALIGAVLIVASIAFSPALVGQFLVGFVEVVANLFEGDS